LLEQRQQGGLYCQNESFCNKTDAIDNISGVNTSIALRTSLFCDPVPAISPTAL
jgi:hypothetical protein